MATTREQIMYNFKLTSISQEDWDAFQEEQGIHSAWTADFDRARGNTTGHDEHDGMDPLMQRLVFPFICLLGGLMLDVLGSCIKLGHINVPSTIFQFVVSLVVAMLASIVLDQDLLCAFQNTYIWSSGAVSPSTIINLLMPVLIFESAFKMSSHAFLSNIDTIVTMAFCCYTFCSALHGTLLWVFMFQFGVTGPSAYLFASMISATDPVAVVALLEELGAPFSVRCIIEGESLINDGMAIVVFKLCTMLWAHDDVWIFNDLEDIGWILGGVGASPIVGYVFGRLCLWTQTTAFNQSARQQQAAIFFSVYIVWILAEVMMQGSGVLALVCFGLTLSHSQSVLKKETVQEAITIWEFFAYWANCIVFIMAGYTLGVQFASDSSYLLTVLQGMLLYPIGLCARKLFMCIYYFVPTPDQRPPISHFICYTWGGLRGALPILLSLELTHVAEQAEMYHTGRLAAETERAVHVNLVLCCGTVLMSLLLQGLSFESLLQKMGLTRDSPYKTAMKHKVFKHLLKHTQHELEQMKSRRTHGGTKWEYVNDVVNHVFNPYNMGLIHQSLLDPAASPNRAQPSISSAYYQPALEHSHVAPIPDESAETWIQVDMAQGTSVEGTDNHEINRSYMLLLKAKVLSAWEEGLLSGVTIEFLTNLIEHAIDRGSVTHVEVFTQLLSKKMSCSRLLHCMGDKLNSAVHYMRKVKLLPYTPREHPKSQDYWYIVSMCMAVTHVALLLVALTNWLYDTDYPEVFMFFDILFVSTFVVEQIVMWPLTKKTLKKPNNRRGRWIVGICLAETGLYALLGVLMLVMVFPYDHGRAYNDPRICLVNKHWVWEQRKGENINHNIVNFCNVSKVLLKIIPIMNALTKIVLTIPRAIYLASEMLRENALRRFRVTLSALCALRFITDDLAVEEFEFPNHPSRKRCIEMNIEMCNLLDMILRKEVMNNTEYAHQIRVIRTRQSARLLLSDIREQIMDRVKTGTLANDDIQQCMQHIDQASEYVGAITRVYDQDEVEQVSIINDAVQSSLLFCAPAVADLLLTFEQFKVPQIFEPDTRMDSKDLPGLIFLYDGVVITYNRRYSEKNFQSPPAVGTPKPKGSIRNVQPETTVRFAGEWLNDFILLDDTAPKSSWLCLTRVKMCVVGMKEVKLMIDADSSFELRRSVADNIARYKLKAYMRSFGRSLTDKQEETLQIQHVSHKQQIIVQPNNSVLIFSGSHRLSKYGTEVPCNNVHLWERTSDCLESTETPLDLVPLPPVLLASYAILPMEDLAAPESTETVHDRVTSSVAADVYKNQNRSHVHDTATISMNDQLPPSTGTDSASISVPVQPTSALATHTAQPPTKNKSTETPDKTSAVKIRALNEQA